MFGFSDVVNLLSSTPGTANSMKLVMIKNSKTCRSKLNDMVALRNVFSFHGFFS